MPRFFFASLIDCGAQRAGVAGGALGSGIVSRRRGIRSRPASFVGRAGGRIRGFRNWSTATNNEWGNSATLYIGGTHLSRYSPQKLESLVLSSAWACFHGATEDRYPPLCCKGVGFFTLSTILATHRNRGATSCPPKTAYGCAYAGCGRHTSLPECPRSTLPTDAFPPTNCPQRRTGTYDEVRRWCRENFLSHPTLERLDSLREQFRQQLAEVGFASVAVPSRRASGRDAAASAGSGGGGTGDNMNSRWRRGGGEGPGKAAAAAWEGEDGGSGPGLQDPDLNSGNLALVQSVLVAGLYPHVAAFVRPDRQSKTRQVRYLW